MIPFFDYRPLYRSQKKETDEAWRRVIESGKLILGPEVRAFEQEFAAYAGARGAVGVNSGTDALILALRALEIGPGDEVITVTNAGVPPVSAIRAVGATPRFVDVDEKTLLMDAGKLDAARTDRTRCVMAVHLYGQAADLDAIGAFCSRHGLDLIEDCAQAHGTTYGGRHVGTFGRVGCFSFYPTKNLGAYGDGGLCVTDDPQLEERMRMVRTYGFREDRHAHCEGLNSRLDELQAALLRVKLRHLDESVEARRRIAAAYREGLEGSSFELQQQSAQGEHAYHLFVVRNSDRPRTIEVLQNSEIGFGIHYAEPVHLMEAYGFLSYPTGSFPCSERACETVLSLPIYPGLSADQVQKVVETLRSLG